MCPLIILTDFGCHLNVEVPIFFFYDVVVDSLWIHVMSGDCTTLDENPS